jgi:hypothetical protein
MKINNACCPASVQNGNVNNEYNKKKNPNSTSFGNAGALVGLATFIETNGFLGEFLTVDTTGMAAPRAIQGYTRNRKELGHLNYKAGAEETIREALSGPAFFFVPAIVLGVAAAIKGKSAKVTTESLDLFKGIMKKSTESLQDLKSSKDIKNRFLDTFTEEAFSGYEKGREKIKTIKSILSDLIDKKFHKENPGITNYFKRRKQIKTAKKQLEEAVTTLNKTNGKYIDSTTIVKIGKKEVDIATLAADIPNYLNDFTKKVQKSTAPKETFIDKFHKTAENVRRTANILAVTALSGFVLVIPTLYQKDKKFPGLEGLNATDADQKKLTSVRVKSGGKNENK